jgi:4-phytase/acid phosphatase
MTRVVLAALDGKPVGGGPTTGPDLKLLGLAGHDTNLVLMASTFGLTWALPGEPDSTAPSTALAFELWRSGAHRYVRAVIWYETLDQLRSLKPALAKSAPLRFEGCAAGPMGGCLLETLKARVGKLIPPDCGLPPAPAPAAVTPKQ